MIEAKFDTHIVRDAKGLHFPKQNNKTTTKPFVDQIFPFANNNTIQNNIQKNLKIFSEKWSHWLRESIIWCQTHQLCTPITNLHPTHILLQLSNLACIWPNVTTIINLIIVHTTSINIIIVNTTTPPTTLTVNMTTRTNPPWLEEESRHSASQPPWQKNKHQGNWVQTTNV